MSKNLALTLAKSKMLQAMAREEQTADFEQLTI